MVNRLYNSGAHHYICKPNAYEQLVKVIHHAISVTLQETFRSRRRKNSCFQRSRFTMSRPWQRVTLFHNDTRTKIFNLSELRFSAFLICYTCEEVITVTLLITWPNILLPDSRFLQSKIVYGLLSHLKPVDASLKSSYHYLRFVRMFRE